MQFEKSPKTNFIGVDGPSFLASQLYPIMKNAGANKYDGKIELKLKDGIAGNSEHKYHSICISCSK